MAKFDTSTIEGYADMSPEEKIAALEGADLPEPDYSGYVKKATFDKTASDLAKAKEQIKAAMSEDEQKKQEAADKMAALEDEVKTLRTQATINSYKSSYLALGYPEELAASTAEAMAKGDMETVFANQRTFNADRKKQIEADLLKSTPHPKTGEEGAVDYAKQIEEARERGDHGTVAYLMRLQQEAAQK